MIHSLPLATYAVLPLGALLMAAWPTASYAGACCVGTTSTVPTQLGPCEKAAAGVAITGASQVARWDGQGTVRSSSLKLHSLRAQVAGSVGFGRRGFATLRVPMMLTHGSAPSMSATGMGVGDVVASVAYRMLEEDASKGGKPMMLAEVGVRAPTGRSWKNAKKDLGVDITGRPNAAMIASLSVQRSVGNVPWFVGASTTLEPTQTGLRPTLDLSAGAGKYLGTRWSMLATVNHNRIWTPTDQGMLAAARTGVGARLVHGQRLAWRGWVGAGSDLPIQHLGVEQTVEVQVNAGFAIVR